MIEDRIIEQIIQHWTANKTGPKYDTNRPAPDFGDVKEVVEKSFLASLRREEDRTIRFRVCLITKYELENFPQYRHELRTLCPPQFFSEEILIKLSPAFDPAQSALAVGREVGSERLQIWGIFHYEPPSHRFNSSPIIVEGGTIFRPDCFTVTVSSPGALQFSRNDTHIGRLVNGEFLSASPTPFTSKSLGQFLIQSLQHSTLWAKHQNFYWHHYRDALQVLLSESALRGHGATIVILGNNESISSETHFLSKYSFDGPQLFESRFENLLDSESQTLPPLEKMMSGIGYRRKINECICLVAQLSAVDGALILANNLEVVAFGATLTAPRWTRKKILGSDGYGYVTGDVFDSERYGTRHNSAIDFAGASPGSIVFVISQDGPVRAFTRVQEDTVMCWPDCTESVFV